MKLLDNRQTFVLIAVAFAVLAISPLIFIHFVPVFDYFWLYVLFWLLLLFIVYYIVIYTSVNKLILNKIKPLLSTVNFLQIPTAKQYNYIDDGEVLKEIDKQFMYWAKSKLQEISELKANEKFRKEFLGNVSHELKTPLFNIQGYISTLIDGGLQDESINLKYLKHSEKNINRLISIVHDLETISALESGDKKLVFERFNVCNLISEVVSMHEIRAKNKAIILEINCISSNNVFVKADKKGIADVLSNLVINSIIYGKENGKTTIVVENKPDKVWISVNDTGIGIEQDDIKRIFERFYRVDKSRSKVQGGTGLGLSIVKHIIEAHNQEIIVESKIGEGTTFTFSLDK
ncbi:MAG: ATP-binding protein [Bacteroidales bacterium]|nr:ATP-binding protein [Bacteroidales bacterium]